MATLADFYGPFDQGAGASNLESRWRDFFQYMRGFVGGRNGVFRGVANKWEVYGDSSGLQVKLKTGEGMIQAHWGKTAVEKTLPVNTNSSGATRVDRVVARANFNNDTVEFECVAGSSPTVPPALVQDASKWEISLAVVTVANGAATIAAGNVADSREYIDFPHVAVGKVASPARASTTTLTADTELVVPLSRLRFYSLRGVLVYTSPTTADFKFDFTGPSGAVGEISGRGLSTAVTTAVGDLDAGVVTLGGSAMTSGGAGTGTKVALDVMGHLNTGETAGDLTLRWAQNTSDVGNTTLYGGSHLILEPLA